MAPKLRFTQKEYASPQSLTVGDLFTFVKSKNKDGQVSNVITNSAEYGLIPQRDFFDKDIAVEGNTSNYTIIHKGDFVYNPRKSTTAPFGPFKCYGLSEAGIVSPLYTCMTPKDKENTPYLLWYFSSSAWHKYIMLNGAQGGARHDRVGMTNELMKGIPVVLPCKEEQREIADFLTAYDEKVSVQQQKVETLERRKSGLLQKVFSQEIRFKTDDGRSFAEWKECCLKDILFEHKHKSTGNEEVFSVSVSKGLVNQIEHLGRSFAASDTSGYKVVHPYDVVYTKSPTGEFKWGIVKQSNVLQDVIVSPLYGVFRPQNQYIGKLLDLYFSSSKRCHNYLITLITKGAKNTINITNTTFLSKAILLPVDEIEQQKIANFFSVIDDQIDIERKRLESMLTIKKGLLQQMFCDE